MKEKLSISQSFERWYVKTGQAAFDQYYTEPIGLLPEHVSAVYRVMAIVGDEVEKKTYEVYVGESNDVRCRAEQHMKKWFGNGLTEWHLGIPMDDFINGCVKLKFEILEYENDPIKRIDKERAYIEKDSRPYLQDSRDGKFILWNDDLPDSCIKPFNGQRKEAFLQAQKEAV